MTLRIPATIIAPDLRFALAPAIASPCESIRIADVQVWARGSLPPDLPVSRYLRYADCDITILAEGVSTRGDLEDRLSSQVQQTPESGELAELSTAVAALDAVDQCFRDSDLWRGNIYLAGADALTAVLNMVGGVEQMDRRAEVVSRELAALELVYLFPIAPKFRAGVYDGQVQFRLNGWGRSLASRFCGTPAGARRANSFKHLIGRHLTTEFRRYECFLRCLDVARQNYQGNVLDSSQSLPIPVLI